MEVLGKAWAAGLPPDQPYDCAIKLLPGTTPPDCRIYPFSLSEQCTIEEYIHGVLEQGYICPSTSPASAGFFFVYA